MIFINIPVLLFSRLKKIEKKCKIKYLHKNWSLIQYFIILPSSFSFLTVSFSCIFSIDLEKGEILQFSIIVLKMIVFVVIPIS